MCHVGIEWYWVLTVFRKICIRVRIEREETAPVTMETSAVRAGIAPESGVG